MPPSSLRAIGRQATIGVVALLALLVGIMWYAHARVAALGDATEWVDRTHRVLEILAVGDVQIVDAEAAERSYLLTRDPVHRARFETAAQGVMTALAQVRILTRDDASQQHRLDTLQAVARETLAALRAGIERAGQGADMEATRTAAADGASAVARYRVLSARMSDAERTLLVQRAARRTTEQHNLTVAMLVRSVVALLVVMIAVWRVRAALIERADAERERDAHAEMRQRQSMELEAQNEELIAQGEALQHAMDQVESANRAKSNFLAQMSHELRTPLNSVIGFANIIRRNPRGALSATDLTYLDRITENGQQLLRTINSILDLSKIEAEQESVELEMVSLGPLVQEVLAQLEPQATQGQVSLVAYVPSPLASIVTDMEKFRRVLINLVANAVKFTKPGGTVSVRIETARRAPTAPVAVEVRDTGIGIAPDRLSAIFEAFEQGDVGVGREFGGTGLGLSISRALCRLLHCELTVSSVLGEGSVFRIGLPIGGALSTPTPRSPSAFSGSNR